MATFLQTSFQSNSADNTASKISLINSSSTPLGIAGIFTGQFENCSSYSLIQVNVSTNQDCTLFVQQSYLGTAENIVAASQFAIPGSTNPLFTDIAKYVYITYPFVRIELVNSSGIAQTSLYLSSKMTSTPPADIILESIAITGNQDLTFAQSSEGAMTVFQPPPTRLTLIYGTKVLSTTVPPITQPNSVLQIQPIAPFYWDMFAGGTSFKYRSITAFGKISSFPSTFTSSTAIISYQYSNDTVNWYGDSQYPSLQILAGAFGAGNPSASITATFSMVGASVFARYVRLWAVVSNYTIDRMEINFQTDVASTA